MNLNFFAAVVPPPKKPGQSSPTNFRPSHVSHTNFSTTTLGVVWLRLATAAMTAKQLSQSEIWDDSALVDSWNEALAEYKVRR